MKTFFILTFFSLARSLKISPFFDSRMSWRKVAVTPLSNSTESFAGFLGSLNGFVVLGRSETKTANTYFAVT